jgi:DNA-binding NarL/FixJ family response regulator
LQDEGAARRPLFQVCGSSSLSRADVQEPEVIALVSAGSMNKQIAGDLGAAEITVKVHRGNAMRKLGAESRAGPI